MSRCFNDCLYSSVSSLDESASPNPYQNLESIDLGRWSILVDKSFSHQSASPWKIQILCEDLHSGTDPAMVRMLPIAYQGI